MKIDVFDNDKKNTSVKSISLIPFFEQEPVNSINPSLKQALEEIKKSISKTMREPITTAENLKR